MDAGAADPLRAARPEEGDEKPKPAESQDDGYETSNSGEAARRKPSSAPASPPPEPPPSPPLPPADGYDPLLRYPDPDYRPYEPAPPPHPPPHQPPQHPPPHQQHMMPDAHHQYHHFPFPKYEYGYKREDAPYDMSQHFPKREEMYDGVKREEDPYSFVEEEAVCAMLAPAHAPLAQHAPPQHLHPHQHALLLAQPKKRGRKKKLKDDNGMEIKTEGVDGAPPRPVKERKKHDRFNGMSEEEVARRTLPDHLAENLDIIIIGINPGLFAAYKGHHYAGPGNHFWKCLYLSGLTREQMSADEDYKLLNFGIGFTNMVPRATKGSADLTRREIKEGSAALLEKLQTFRPKVAVFNGKLIYEVFSGKKDFCFGKQPDTIAGTNTYMWVMPSSSARCAQLPRAADKVPFYAALKKFRDYLNGLLPHLDEAELVFPDTTSRRPQEEMEIRRLTMEPEPGDTMILEDGTEVPLKKKRGRPKKVKLENGEPPPAPRPRPPRPPPALDADQPPKKKRGRPKKIRPEDQQFLLQQQQQQQQQQQHQQQQQQQPGGVGLGGALGGLGLQHDQYMPHGDFQPDMLYHQHQPLQDPQYFQAPNAGGGMEGGMEAGLGLARGYSSPGGYGASPRAAYHSPRSQGYSPSPARPSPTPQFPSSPAAFSAVSPPRAYGSPAGVGGARAAYAQSPAYPHQPSPAHTPRYHDYPQGVQATPARPYSRSPASGVGAVGGGGGGTTPFPAASPAALHSYTPSPAHTPYSQHSSPAPAHNHLLPQGGLGAELSSDIGAAISSPGGAGAGSAAPSPPLALDFEPPAPHSPDLHAATSSSSLSDYAKNASGSVGGSVSPGSGGGGGAGGGAGGSFGGALYDERLPYRLPPAPAPQPAADHYHYQDRGDGVADSPRLDQMHQHPSMYPSNFNRSTPPGEGGEGGAAGGPYSPHTPHHHPGSPGEFCGPKSKPQDVASKSLSGLESLVDQIPSIAEGPAEPAPAPALPDYPALYPYSYTGPYPNNGYGAPFVGYGGGWGATVMRPTPGYLADWQYPYPAPAPVPYAAPYYTPPPAHHQQPHYLSAPPLIDLHKSGEHSGGVPSVPSVPSVGFGGFC